MKKHIISLKLFFVFTAILASGLFLLSVHAATDQSININANVPGGSSTGGQTTDNPPTISNIASTTSYTTANISWSANDDNTLSSGSFNYGLQSGTYDLIGTISGSFGSANGTFQTNLSGLATNTVYYFKISISDNAAHTTEAFGSFKTIAYSQQTQQDTTPPIISSVNVVIGVTTATISWVTNEDADSHIKYGLTTAYGNNQNDATKTKTHSIFLSGLLPNTTYNYQILSTDAFSNTASTINATFTTAADAVSPPNVSNFTLTTTSNSFILSWTNPTLVNVPDFVGVKILRKINSYSVGSSDGTVVYTGSAETFTDISFAFNTKYYYTIFSFDTSNNYSTGIYQSGQINNVVPVTEICNNSIDDDNNGKTDCADDACKNLLVCKPPTLQENCSNGTDDDGDNKIDCADNDCVGSAYCATPGVIPEICNNNIDDDGDGKIDCLDNDCNAYSGCKSPSPAIGGSTACSNSKDDDNDGLMDYPTDPGCDGPTDNDEYNPQASTVPSFAKISLTDLRFYSGNGKILLTPSDSTVSGLSGADLTVVFSNNSLAITPKKIILKSGDTDQYIMSYNEGLKSYSTTLSFPKIGIQQAYLEIDYGSNQTDSLGFKTKGVQWGDVFGDKQERISGAKISLLNADGSRVSLENYNQLNPIITNANSVYGWMVPNGKYYLTASKDGYYDRSTAVFVVSDNIVNTIINLIYKPPTLLENVNFKAPSVETAKQVVKNISKKTTTAAKVAAQNISDTVKAIEEIKQRPEVQEATKNIVAPAAIGVVAVGAIPLITWMDFLPLLRLLFLQPLMMLGWRKREKWGIVYNSLNKQPIDLAMVRLVDSATGKTIQSRVTDDKGRYSFIIDPGKYILIAQKNGFNFPSLLLKNFKDDGRRTDVYHGEPLNVGEKHITITPNIPLDPVGDNTKPKRLIWQRVGRTTQIVLSWVGIVITAISLYISPTWYIAGLLMLHLLLYYLFSRLAVFRPVKNWGIIYDVDNKKPIFNTIARLFNAQFNKVVSTIVTDHRGRYQFLAGDDKYYVTFERKGYNTHKTNVIDLSGKETEAITTDIPLKKSIPTNTVPPIIDEIIDKK